MLYLIGLLIICWVVALRSFSVKLNFSSKQIPAYEVLANQLTLYNPEESIPSYKFYGKLLTELLAIKKKFGAPIQTATRELRGSLNRDVKSDYKIKQITTTSLLQYLSMCGFIWILLWQMSAAVGKQIYWYTIILILGWQVLGAYIFWFAQKVLKRRICSPFANCFPMLYFARCLIRCSRPMQEVRALLERASGSGMQHLVRRRLSYLLDTIKVTGRIDCHEFDFLIEEVWDRYEIALEKLEKSMLGLKLCSFLLFILPCYFFVVLESFSGDLV